MLPYIGPGKRRLGMLLVSYSESFLSTAPSNIDTDKITQYDEPAWELAQDPTDPFYIGILPPCAGWMDIPSIRYFRQRIQPLDLSNPSPQNVLRTTVRFDASNLGPSAALSSTSSEFLTTDHLKEQQRSSRTYNNALFAWRWTVLLELTGEYLREMKWVTFISSIWIALPVYIKTSRIVDSQSEDACNLLLDTAIIWEERICCKIRADWICVKRCHRGCKFCLALWRQVYLLFFSLKKNIGEYFLNGICGVTNILVCDVYYSLL